MRKKKEGSLRGRLLRDLISDITATANIGTKIQNGEFRRRPVEPEWRCPEGYVWESIPQKDFNMEWIAPKEAANHHVILQLHGGGYIGPMKNIYRKFAVNYSEAGKGANILTIDYRVAPEYPYPAALEDAYASYQWLLAQGYEAGQIIIAGDSAGGGLALCLIHYLKYLHQPLPAGVITMSAWTDLTLSGESYQSNYEQDPLFGNTTESMIYNREYLGDYDPSNPFISPLFGDFTGFPPLLLQVGSCEMLLSDTLSVAQKARMQKVKVKLSVYEGMFHVFQMSGPLLPECKKAWKEIGKYLEKIWIPV